ncbi:hypothetical protein FQA39_LY11430 [Lamprigera yunnana]|nr:hypothetical protein FQA39_LY11430 [Lamprigera yunnana]
MEPAKRSDYPTSDINVLSHKKWGSKEIERDENDVELIVIFINDDDNRFENCKTELRTLTKEIRQLYEREKCSEDKKIVCSDSRVQSLYISSLPQKYHKKRKENVTTNVSSTIMLTTQRNIKLEDLLKHELLDYPPSLENESGHLKERLKCELINIIESENTAQSVAHSDLGAKNAICRD